MNKGKLFSCFFFKFPDFFSQKISILFHSSPEVQEFLVDWKSVFVSNQVSLNVPALPPKICGLSIKIGGP